MSDEQNGIEEEEEGVEEMAAFFNLRADGYDEHMREVVFSESTFAQFYQALAAPIAKTSAAITILDLGCGTGLEIGPLLQAAPNALITGVDLSSEMLERLQERCAAQISQITLVTDSYLTMPFAAQSYDYVLSSMTAHHFLPDTKLALYRKVHAALKPGGKYIEGDSVTLAEAEAQFLAEYQQQTQGLPPAQEGHYHIDMPFSLETQRRLLLEAGFHDFELIWQKESADLWNVAVYVVTA